MKTNGFKGLFNTSSINVSAINAYNKAIEDEIDSQKALEDASKGCNKETINLMKSAEGAIVTEEALANAQNQTTISAKASALAMKGLAIAGNMFAGALIGLAISKVSNYLSSIGKEYEELQEKIEEATSAYEESQETIQSNAKTIDSIKDRYVELSKGVDNFGKNLSLTTSGYEEYNDMTSQIADMFPNLIQGYTETGDAILKNKGSLEDLNAEYEKYKLNAANELVGSDTNPFKKEEAYKDKSYSDQQSALSSYGANKYTFGLLGNKNAISITTEQEEKIYKTILDSFKNSDTKDDYAKKIEDLYTEYLGYERGTYAIDDVLEAISKSIKSTIGFNIDDYDKAKNALSDIEAKYQNLLSEQSTVLEQQHDFANAILTIDENSNENYQNLSEAGKKYAEQITTGFSTEIGDSFDSPSELRTWMDSIYQELSNEDTVNIIDKLLGLDSEDIPYGEYVNQVESLVSTLADKLDMSEDEIKLQFGIDDVDETNLINSIKANFEDEDTLGGISVAIDDKSKEDIYDYVDSLSKNDLKILATMKIDKNTSLQDIQDFIARARRGLETGYDPIDIFGLGTDDSQTKLGELSSELDEIQSAYSTMDDAMTSYNSSQGMTVDQLQSLISQGDDWLNYLVDENGNLQLDTESMQDLTEARLQDMEAQIQSNLIDTVTAITNENDALKYLSSTNYEVADSYQALASAKLEAWAAEAKASNSYSSGTVDKVLAKQKADSKKISKLFSKVNISPTSLRGTSSNSGSSSSTDSYEKEIDWYKELVEEYNNVNEQINQAIDNANSSATKNSLVDMLIGNTQNHKSDIQKAIQMYSQEAQSELAKIPSQFKSLAQNGGIAITDFIGSGNEDVVDAIEKYRSLSSTIDDLTQESQKLIETLNQYQVDKFNNIADDYTKQLDIITTSTDKIQSVIDQQKQLGNNIGEGLYQELISQTKVQIDYLNQERNALANQMNTALANGVKISSDDWNDMRSKLSDIDSEIIDCTTSMDEFQNSINDLHWDSFNDVEDALSGINSQLSTMAGFLNTDTVLDDNGDWTADALTELGLLAQQYELAQVQVQDYADEITYLNNAYQQGLYSDSEYQEKLAELTDSQLASAQSVYEMRQAIIDLNKTRVSETCDAIDKETDAYKKLVDAQKEKLEADKKAKDSADEIADKTKTIEDIQRQINAMQNSTSASDKNKVAQLKAELDDAKKDLADYYSDQEYNAQIEALDKSVEDYETAQEDKKTTLEDSLDNEETIIKESLSSVTQNYKTVYSTLTKLASKYNVNLSSAITTPWQSGEDAIAQYGTILTGSTSSFVGQLTVVKSNIYANQIQANNLANSLISTFGLSSANLQYQLSTVQNWLQYDSSTVDSLRSNIIDTLSRSYDTSGLIGSLQKIQSSASRASSTFANGFSSAASQVGVLNAAIGTANYALDSMKNKIGILPTALGALNLAGATINVKNSVGAYAKGGLVSNKGNILNSIANSVGEDTMIAVRYGERVLTEKQNVNWEKCTNALPDLVKLVNPLSNLASNIPDYSSLGLTNQSSGNVTFGSLINVEGNVDKDVMPDLEKVINTAFENYKRQQNRSLRKTTT